MEPEIIIEKPNPKNNFKWLWSICQPDANWGVLYEGTSDSYEECRRRAQYYYDQIIDEYNMKDEILQEKLFFDDVDKLSVFNIKVEDNKEKPKKLLSEIIAGDKVYLGCVSSLGASSEGVKVVEKITVQYDENTGVPYNVIWCGGDKFDSRTGGKMDKWSVFYIEPYE
jgi:hypothetical protein